jgi:hypothetical protein
MMLHCPARTWLSVHRPNSLSALGGGEGQGEVGDVAGAGIFIASVWSAVAVRTAYRDSPITQPRQPHLTPALSAPRGGEGEVTPVLVDEFHPESDR